MIFTVETSLCLPGPDPPPLHPCPLQRLAPSAAPTLVTSSASTCTRIFPFPLLACMPPELTLDCAKTFAMGRWPRPPPQHWWPTPAQHMHTSVHLLCLLPLLKLYLVAAPSVALTLVASISQHVHTPLHFFTPPCLYAAPADAQIC